MYFKATHIEFYGVNTNQINSKQLGSIFWSIRLNHWKFTKSWQSYYLELEDNIESEKRNLRSWMVYENIKWLFKRLFKKFLKF